MEEKMCEASGATGHSVPNSLHANAATPSLQQGINEEVLMYTSAIHQYQSCQIAHTNTNSNLRTNVFPTA